jgi:hypothetical protein
MDERAVSIKEKKAKNSPYYEVIKKEGRLN